MNFNEFINKHLGEAKDYDGVSGVQCVDLAKMYLNEVFGIKPGSWGNAKYYWINFPQNSAMKNAFTKISNSASFVPKRGDICIWKGSINGGYGHIAIATGEGDVRSFYTYDQNWGGKAMRKVKHTYKSFYGVLRPKDQSKIVATIDGFVTWRNGSTKENIFKTSKLADRIGSMNPEEEGWCYGKANGNYAVVYNIAKGHYKVGFAKYSGGVDNAPTQYRKWKNGSTEEIVYADTSKKEVIGKIFKRGEAKCLGCLHGMYLVMYEISNTGVYKVGFVDYEG